MLSINFHETFVPERIFIKELLSFAAMGKQGTIIDLSQETGIPMGKSTGKMSAILNYAKGMGLISYSNKQKIKKPDLTPLGKVVYFEDKFLGEEITQWLVHMNLCRQDIGAQIWHKVFAQGSNTLGYSFSEDQLEDYLVSLFGSGKKRTGPLIRTYLEDAALSRSGVLIKKNARILRQKAPLNNDYALAYAAYIINLAEVFFPEQIQITTSDFNNMTYWFDICLWSEHDIDRMFSMVESTGFISVDKQMSPWILEIKNKAEVIWPKIFDNLA